MSAAALTPEDALALYATLQSGPLAGTPVATLHFGGAQGAVASGRGVEPVVQVLDIGTRVLAATCLHHAPPTAAELEQAIERAEDAVMPARAALVPGATLYTADAGIRQVAIAAGIEAQPEMRLPIDALESAFNRLADRASGRPVAQDTLPDDSVFAATLVLLRECLHHWGLDGIVIRSDAVV
jgi:hypothetical protein